MGKAANFLRIGEGVAIGVGPFGICPQQRFLGIGQGVAVAILGRVSCLQLYGGKGVFLIQSAAFGFERIGAEQGFL